LWNFSYRLVYARFDGNRDGTQDLTYDEVVWDRAGGETRTADNFPVVPLVINQQAHIFGVGYDISPRWTINLLVRYIHQNTDHKSVIPGFDEFLISSSGIGDISLSASRPVWRRNQHFVAASVGVSLPVGSIDEIGPTPRDPDQDTQLPYTMQIGSGTIDVLQSLVYSARGSRYTWGGRARGTFRIGETDRNYTLGNRLSVSGWLEKPLRPWLQPSVRVSLQKWGRIDGRDTDLQIDALPVSPYPAAVTDPDKFGGTKVHVTFGATLMRDAGSLARHALQLEAGLPVYQSLHGPQPKEIFRLGAGWKWSL
ncbi:MAG: hypothetical protein HOC05_10560, partial [Gemmatimonadetes bacterium]|nr:hypothetical protein [Gemmatimonadota bacterium]